MSDHIDSPSAIEDGRLDLCDMYAFDGEMPRTTVLIFTVNPDAGKSSPTTFHPEALYEIKLDTDGDAVEDVTYRMTLGEPDTDGAQSFRVGRVEGEAARYPVAEGELLEGRTGEMLGLTSGGRAWAGLAADPFFGDGIALERFREAALEGRYDPEAFAQDPVNLFSGRNVTGVAQELPTAFLGADSFSLWGVTSAPRDGELVRTDRWGTPLVQHIFINHDHHLADEYNIARPEGDPKTYGAHVSSFVEKLTTAAGTARDPAAYGRHVAEMLLLNVLPYNTREPAKYGPQSRNGHTMDDVYDVMVSLVANTPGPTAWTPMATTSPTFLTWRRPRNSAPSCRRSCRGRQVEGVGIR